MFAASIAAFKRVFFWRVLGLISRRASDPVCNYQSNGANLPFSRNNLFPATQPGGGLNCQSNVTKCQDKQRLRDYLFRINFILPSSA